MFFRYQLFVLQESSLRRNPFIRSAKCNNELFLCIIKVLIIFDSHTSYCIRNISRLGGNCNFVFETCEAVSETSRWSTVAITGYAASLKMIALKVHFYRFRPPLRLFCVVLLYCCNSSGQV